MTNIINKHKLFIKMQFRKEACSEIFNVETFYIIIDSVPVKTKKNQQ